MLEKTGNHVEAIMACTPLPLLFASSLQDMNAATFPSFMGRARRRQHQLPLWLDRVVRQSCIVLCSIEGVCLLSTDIPRGFFFRLHLLHNSLMTDRVWKLNLFQSLERLFLPT